MELCDRPALVHSNWWQHPYVRCGNALAYMSHHPHHHQCCIYVDTDAYRDCRPEASDDVDSILSRASMPFIKPELQERTEVARRVGEEEGPASPGRGGGRGRASVLGGGHFPAERTLLGRWTVAVAWRGPPWSGGGSHGPFAGGRWADRRGAGCTGGAALRWTSSRLRALPFGAAHCVCIPLPRLPAS